MQHRGVLCTCLGTRREQDLEEGCVYPDVPKVVALLSWQMPSLAWTPLYQKTIFEAHKDIDKPGGILTCSPNITYHVISLSCNIHQRLASFESDSSGLREESHHEAPRASARNSLFDGFPGFSVRGGSATRGTTESSVYHCAADGGSNDIVDLAHDPIVIPSAEPITRPSSAARSGFHVQSFDYQRSIITSAHSTGVSAIINTDLIHYSSGHILPAYDDSSNPGSSSERSRDHRRSLFWRYSETEP